MQRRSAGRWLVRPFAAQCCVQYCLLLFVSVSGATSLIRARARLAQSAIQLTIRKNRCSDTPRLTKRSASRSHTIVQNHCHLYTGATTGPLVGDCDIDVPFSIDPP